uniref:Uncharacterized protein n=1 Tax=Anopheles farauti TaxID=69004 RepID=A0A182QAM9_9DIPT
MCEENAENEPVAIGEIFDAIADGDEESLGRCLEKATIGTMLKFEATYDVSPLAVLLEAAAMNHLGLVRRLLRSGLCDCEMTDGKGRTVLAKLVQAPNANPAFVEHIVQLVVEGMDDATACYRILKHNSTRLFKIYLELRHMDEAQLFQSLTGALIQLSVRCIRLTPELKVFAMWKLADYGYRHLTGDWRGDSTDEWSNHVDVVVECWSAICKRYDTRKCDDIDDRLLHRLHAIHNHLYFLQHKRFLGHLPMREVVFCLAIFLNIFKDSHKFAVYRFMVDKCQVMEFVRMIVSQLALIKKTLKTLEQEIVVIVDETKQLEVQRKDRLMRELMEKINGSDMKNKSHIVKQLEEKVQATDLSDGHRLDALIEAMFKRVRHIDKTWAKEKIRQLKAIHSARRDRLIVQITQRLECAAHPQNVADRLIALANQTNSAYRIAAEITAREMFDLEYLVRGKDRRTRRRLAQCYTQMKQFYSLQKVIIAFTRIAQAVHASTVDYQDSLRRIFMVLGEALKNTKSTPNMPNDRVEEAMNCMLTEQFSDINIFYRNHYAGGFSLTRLQVANEVERRILQLIPDHKAMIGAMLHLLFTIVLVNNRRSFYGTLLHCGSLEKLRALLTYVGEKDLILPLQHGGFEKVQEYFNNTKALFTELRLSEVGGRPQFAHLDAQFKFQCSLFEEVEAMVAAESGFDYESLRKSCFSCDDAQTVRRLLLWKMESYHPNRLLEGICTKWDPCTKTLSCVSSLDLRLKWIDPTNMSCKLAMMATALRAGEEGYCLSHTRKLIEDIKLADGVDEQELQTLRDMLRPYYENIFLLDSKWQVLETFCTQRQLPWDKTLARQQRVRDREQLQALFDNRRNKLRIILEQNGITTVDVLHVGVLTLTDDILAALEYLQLELCEMLTAVGYFGDSFHYMKHRIPMIQGKNYRNLLAHDSLSYNLLTASDDSKLVINAFVFAHTEVRLFERRSNVSVHLSFPTLENTYDWVEQQQQLLGAIKEDNVIAVHAMIRSGVEINAETCDSKMLRELLERYRCMRRLDGIGVLGNIVCTNDPSVLPFCTEQSNEITRCLEDVISTALASISNEVRWQTFAMDTGVTFYIQSHTTTAIRSVPPMEAKLFTRETASLLSNLRIFGSSLLCREHPVVYATFSKENCTEHFLKIDNSYCAFDVFPPDTDIDLTKTINARASDGATVLRKAVECAFDIDSIELLMENGANPLLADDYGVAPIHTAIGMEPESLALYLMDECLKRDLRNGSGVSVFDLDEEWTNSKLIHSAASNGHEAVIVRLLAHNIDVTEQNEFGQTPAQIVAMVPRFNSISLMKLLLDYDRRPVDMFDSKGYSLLFWVARFDSIEMLNLILQYNPDFTAYPHRAALYEAVSREHIEWAKRFLQHASAAGVRGVTKMEDEGYDVVIQSLRCTNFDLSKALLEYELEHPLEAVTECDRPRIEAVLKAATTRIPHVPLEHLIALRGLNASDNFLTFLRSLLDKLPQQAAEVKLITGDNK